jgi:hydrogenase expression/formation protein HypC
MCLAIPMKIVSLEGELARVEQAGVAREVSLAMLPEARVGDHVLVHAGFAIERLSEAQALETLELLRAVAAAGEDPDPAPEDEGGARG